MSDLFTIIKFGEPDEAIDVQIGKRRCPEDPLEFLCLAVARRRSTDDFPNLCSVSARVKKYRDREVQAAHDAIVAGEFFAPPIGILVLTGPAPQETEDWRADCQVREELTRAGAMIVERSDRSGHDVDDGKLIHETVQSILAAANVAHPAAGTATTGGGGFEWTIAPPSSPAAKAFSRQPSAVEPHPDESRDPAADFAQQLETYSKADPRDLDY